MEQLRELYSRYKGAVFGYLYRMTGSAQEAEELTQESFYQALLSLHRFRGDGAVTTWLLRIARNVYLKQLRRHAREAPVPFPEERVPDSGPAPDQDLIRLDEQVAVRAALSRLPEQYRTALVLREVQGLSHAEIGLILAKSEPTVRVLLHRARQRLNELYQEEEKRP